MKFFQFQRNTQRYQWRVMLACPVMIGWKAKIYDVNSDEMRRGWVLYWLVMDFGKLDVYGLRIAHGMGIFVAGFPWFTAVIEPQIGTPIP